MKLNLLFLSLFTIFVLQINAQNPCVKSTWKEPYKTSWLLNDGGNQAKHVMHWMEYLFVRPDGVTATVTGWDEGGSNVTVFNTSGNIQSVPEGSGTGGWGRMSMIGVALDDKYTYQLLSQHGCDGANSSNNANKLPQYPACGDSYTWKTVRRYNVLTGKSAPFPKGYGFAGDMLIVHSGTGDLKGIAILKNEIFVADESGDSVKVYNKTTMDSKPLRKFKFEGGIGQLSPDNKGGMWMLQSKTKQIIRFDIASGIPSSQSISFPEEVVATTFFVDTIANRILVADNGINQNIRIYTDISGTPAFTSTFGTQYGILSGVAGKYEPLKLFDIKGVGADAQGNIYVANSISNGGAVLQAYKPDGTLLWDKKGLVFTSTACADPNHNEDVYTFDKRVKMDYSKTAAGSEWSFEAFTLNRFKYPDDPRLHGGFFTSSWVKYINGQKFLFATDMYASVLAGFRFSPETDGEIAIPCLLMNVGGYNATSDYPKKFGTEKDYIWMDKNGDGSIQDDEFDVRTGIDNPYSMAIWVDTEGNIWKGVRENGVRFIPLKEVNSKGVPVYNFADSKLLDIARGDIGTNGVKRLVFDSEKDELYIAGFSTQKPDVKANGVGNDDWWCMGSTVCMYKDVLKTMKSNPSANFKTVVPNWKIFIPFAADGDAGSENSAKSFTVEGDYMFIALARNGNINVYKRDSVEYLGQIQPGAEINRQSGWTDIDYSINVTKTASEYLIFNEENAFAKVVMYRVKSFETNDQLFSDLVPSDFEILNANNEVITNLVQKQPVHFRIKMTNQGPGAVPAGKNYSVLFTVKNLKGGASKYLYADTCTQSVAPGKSIELTSFSKTKSFEWTVEKGKFSITSMIQTSNITECDKTNNSFIFTTDSYDTLHIETFPENKTVNVGGTASFSIEVLGDGPVSYKWFVNDVEQSNMNSNQFTLTNLTAEQNNARIKVVATNPFGNVTSNEAKLTVSDPYGASRIGYLLKQTWINIDGTAINDLTSYSNYPGNPDSIDFIDQFEIPTNIADKYGVRVSGWIIAPETGNYTFYIASDDNGQLKLSTDSLPKNLRTTPIANVPDWTDSRKFDKFPQQTSAPISLVAGKKYFVEALFKEGDGGDNLAVAWKLPSGKMETPIPSSRLAFYNQPTGIAEIAGKVYDNLQIYPSPASEFIHIKSSCFDGQVKVSISDILGRLVKTAEMNFNRNTVSTVNISELKPGIYLLSVSNQTNSVNSKFVINR